MSEMDEKDLRAEEHSYATDATSYILLAAGCPTKFRTFIDCLIGIADGNVEFEASDQEIAARAKGNKNSSSKSASKGWARDRRRDLNKWQKENQFNIFNFIPGGRDEHTDTYIKTQYELYIIDYIKQVIADARANAYLWQSNKHKAIKLAAENFVRQLQSQVYTPTNPSRYKGDPYHVSRTRLRTAKTYIKQALDILQRFDISLPRDDEAEINEIESLLDEIKKRGFVDDFFDLYYFDGSEWDDQ